MDTVLLLTIMTTALFSTNRLVTSNPLGPDSLQLTEGTEEDPEATEGERRAMEQQEEIVTFLALLEKAEKIASSRFAAKITGVKANTKLFGKKNRMDEAREDHSNPSFHHEESVDQTDELTINNPMRGKHFRKVPQTVPRKTKKRACFWKYCIQNK